MSNYITKEELAADLIKIYTAAKRKVVKEGSTMEDKQGKRVSASFTVMKDCINLLKSLEAIESVDELVPVLNLD